MRIAFITLCILCSHFCFSQSVTELEKLKKDLVSQKESFKQQIVLIDIKVDSINKILAIAQLKKKSVKTKVKRSSNFLSTPSKYSSAVCSTVKKDPIYIIEFDKKGSYYKAVYRDKAGYILRKNIYQTKSCLQLVKASGYKRPSIINNYINSFSTGGSSSRSSYRSSRSRTYYRGPRGGCYYINSNGNKTYVSRSLCN